MFSFFRLRKSPDKVVADVFPYPFSPCPPIAVLPPYVTSTPVVDFAKSRTLAAPMQAIRALNPAEWSPEYPVIVLSNLRDGLMNDADRDYIWKIFRIPVFEYLLDDNGEILARECEAHEGLHLARALAPSRDAVVTEQPCACGQSGTRLMTLATSDGANAII
jgi:hypothetical protein